jgi:DamX protein
VIGVFKKKTELPEYLAHYGMHRAPFSSAAEDDMYYTDPTRQQRLDVLLHLAQNSNELLVVTGEQGMGKTMFLRQFVNNTGEHWKVCQLDGHKMMTEEQFLQRIYMGFEIAYASTHKNTMLANLKKRLDSLLQQALPVILLVDNAHLFPTKVLSLILEIASIKNLKTGNSVRVILFSEPQIKIILAEPELDEKHKLIVRKIDLPPLDETHTGNYLHHRLSQAGMEAERFLTKPTIHKIFKQSNGIPAEINAAADKLLFETTPIIRRTSNVRANQGASTGKIIFFIIAIVVIVATLFFFQDDLQELINDTKVDLSDTKQVTDKTADETITQLTLPALDSTTVESADPMQSLKEELADIPVDKPDQPGQPKTEVAIQGEQDQPTKLTKVKDTEIKEKNPVTEQHNQKIKDATWLLQQNPENYTLQLVTGHKQSTIDKFIAKYQLKPQQLCYFFSTRNEKHWHNLIYGIYPNRKTANSAIQQLPSQLASVKPWIRQIRSIQSEINQSQ